MTGGAGGPESAGGGLRDAWESYWQGTAESAAHRRGGPQDVVLARFWEGLFRHFRGMDASPRVLDFACGNGVVTQFAMAALGSVGRAAPVLVGLDASIAAAVAYRARFPVARAVVADAGKAPLADASFDVVASQFGIEYAEPAAVGEAARLVAPGGILAMIVHRKDGVIHRECDANLRAVRRVIDSRLLAHATEVFRRGASVTRGRGSRSAFQEADRRLSISVAALEGVLQEFGSSVAGGTLSRLYEDLAYLYRRMGAHDPLEVADWAGRMTAEMDAYAGRMAGMIHAARDAEQFEELVSRAGAVGLAPRVRDELRMGPGAGAPGAWMLVAERPRV